ncbi:hypothetical protein [Vreelandella aquamarina]|uniref:Tail tape measure protein n=1 Tax=Vreelandella aquamarina TaxID=77097 RepID=A0A857GLE4_9GAMM|nr:hypothetical protein [Halomonas meridiana]QHD50062.1 hypothetical protein CTT34_10355 [Halomonas meridiana]
MAYKSTLHIAIDSTGAEKQLKRLEDRLELTEKSGKKTSGSIGRLTATMKAAGGVMLGLGASAGVFTAIARNAAQSAAEIDNLSRLANTNAQDFQRLAFASSAYGVEQEKLADILKDTNDRVGDFLSTGGGEMKDFFEQIAPQIGITAEEFRNLSGPEALQKYYDGLQAANLSQAEMTFYMESVADEATALIPLLRDGGAEMDRLGKEADDLNAVLSNMEIQRLKDIRGEFSQLGQQLSTETMRAVSQFDELFKSSLEGISTGVNSVARGFNVFMDSFRDAEAMRSLTAIDQQIAEIEGRLAGGTVGSGVLGMGGGTFTETALAAAGASATINEFNAELITLRARKEELQRGGPVVEEPEIVSISRATAGTSELADAIKDVQQEADRFASTLQSLTDRLFPVEAAQRAYREEQAALTRAWNEGTITADRYTEAMLRLERAQLSTQTAAGAYGSGGGFGSEIGSRGGVGAPTDPLAGIGGNQDKDYWQKWLDSAETALTDFDQLAANTAENFQRGFGNAFESMVFDSESTGDAVRNMFQGIARTLVNTLGQMAAQWLAYQAVQLAMGKSSEAAAIGSAVATGSSIAAAYAPAAAAASLASFGANSVPAMAGMSATYGLSSTLALTGFSNGGYTGPGGKYDPAGIVHAGEFVVRKEMVERPGVLAMLEGLNRGYANGGYVGSSPAASDRLDNYRSGSMREGSQPALVIEKAGNHYSFQGKPDKQTIKLIEQAEERAYQRVLRDARRNLDIRQTLGV